MKKLFLILLLATYSLFPAEYNENATRLYNPEEARNVLGYDPLITQIKETDNVVPSKRKTVYFHGFGGNKDAAALVKYYYGSERLPGEIITFDFPDANNQKMDIAQSSLGQWNDMKTALYVLKKLHDFGETEIGITAHSRGGATAINMVAALVDQEDHYKDRLSKIGINEEKRKAILTMLQNDHIVLECPLLNVRKTIKHQVKQTSSSFLGSIGKWLSSLSLTSSSMDYSSESLATSINYSAPLVLKQYRPWNEQPIQSVEHWNNAQIPTIVHFQENDEVLGNEMNDEFYAKLQQANGTEYTYMHQGSDSGHNSSFQSFAPERNLFLKKYGAAYMPINYGAAYMPIN